MRPVIQQRPQRLHQVQVEQQVAHSGGLPTRNDQPVNRLELTAAAYRQRVGSGFAQRCEVLPGIALQRQDSDPWRAHCFVQ